MLGGPEAGLKCFGFSGIPAARHTAGFSEPMVLIGYILAGAFCLHFGPQLERELLTPPLKPLCPPPAGCPIPLADCPCSRFPPCRVVVEHPGPFATACPRPSSPPSL